MQLARNEVADCSNPKLDIFLSKGGSPVDVSVLEYQIFDVSDPVKQLTPLQVYPPVGRAVLDPTTDCPAGARLSTGRYAAAWTVPVDQVLGSHEIRWFWKETAFSPEETFSEEFEVTATIASSTDDLYITVQVLRDLGIDAGALSDTDAEKLIRRCQAVLDRACRQWFNERTLQFKFDGTDSDAIHFGIPIVSIDWIKLNDDPNVLDPRHYRVYNGRDYPDDRRNPRVKLIHDTAHRDIYTAPLMMGRLLFRKGRQNQEVRGKFGFLESDGSPPEAIQEALTRLVVEKYTNPVYVAPGSSPPPSPPSGGGGTIMEEWTDGHKVKFATAPLATKKAGLSGITRDAFVQDVIKLYRAPIGVATPAHWSFR